MTVASDTAAAISTSLTAKRTALVTEVQGALARGQADTIVLDLLGQIRDLTGMVDALTLVTS